MKLGRLPGIAGHGGGFIAQTRIALAGGQASRRGAGIVMHAGDVERIDGPARTLPDTAIIAVDQRQAIGGGIEILWIARGWNFHARRRRHRNGRRDRGFTHDVLRMDRHNHSTADGNQQRRACVSKPQSEMRGPGHLCTIRDGDRRKYRPPR